MNLGDILPAGAVFDFEALGLWEASVEHCTPILFGRGHFDSQPRRAMGRQKVVAGRCQSPSDYWYDPESSGACGL
jgi:hypothetical protein